MNNLTNKDSMSEHKPQVSWRYREKILFRFFFTLLLLLSQIAYNPFLNLLGYGYRKEMQLVAHLKGVVSSLDDHIFHLGFLPAQHALYFSDTHFGVVLLLTILIISGLACIVWTMLDTRRANYNRLYYWFSTYLAFYIFLAMFTYAIQKVIPIQAHYPTAPELLTRWGDLRNWELLFRFMGTSPAYCMFCGWLELIASILILFSRTRVLGGLIMIIVLVQVVLFNIFYNNNVILLSGVLLLATVFILAPSLSKLLSIFIALKPVSLVQYKYGFTTGWKKLILIAIYFLPLWKIYKATTKSWAFYNGLVRNQEKQKLYNVIFFQKGNDTLPPLTTDSLRWDYVCFLDYGPGKQQLIKFDKRGNQQMYSIRWDSMQKKILFPKQQEASLAYEELPGEILRVSGNWHGEMIDAHLKLAAIDSLTLVKDKFLFMQEDQD